MNAKFKKLCKKCKTYFLPYKGAHSRFSICQDCRVDSSKCKAINEAGYQCVNKAEIFGYCTHHFLTQPVKNLVKDVKKEK